MPNTNRGRFDKSYNNSGTIMYINIKNNDKHKFIKTKGNKLLRDCKNEIMQNTEEFFSSTPKITNLSIPNRVNQYTLYLRTNKRHIRAKNKNRTNNNHQRTKSDNMNAISYKTKKCICHVIMQYIPDKFEKNYFVLSDKQYNQCIDLLSKRLKIDINIFKKKIDINTISSMIWKRTNKNDIFDPKKKMENSFQKFNINGFINDIFSKFVNKTIEKKIIDRRSH